MKPLLLGTATVGLMMFAFVIAKDVFARNEADSAQSSASHSLKVTETTNFVRLSSTTIDPGEVKMVVRNRTTKPDEFIVLKSSLPAGQLPMKDGKFDVTAQGAQTVLDKPGIPVPKGESELTVNLAPGNYLVISKPLDGSKMLTANLAVKAPV